MTSDFGTCSCGIFVRDGAAMSPKNECNVAEIAMWDMEKQARNHEMIGLMKIYR